MRRIVTIAALIVIVGVAGCGGGELPAPTTTVAAGTQVSPSRYLADAAAGAEAVRTFAGELGAIGPVATAELLKQTASRLAPPLDRARIVGQRLSAERLADSRLEQQRERTAAAFTRVVAAMEGVSGAAAAGDPTQAKIAAAALRAEVETLRTISTASP